MYKLITFPPALQPLADQKRFVAYSGAPKGGGKIDKAPLNPKTGRPAHNDKPATWGTLKAAQECARELWRPGNRPGVGVQLGDLRDSTFLCGVDLDGCYSLIDGLEPWAEAIYQRFRSYAEVSPSASGVKLYFRVKAEDLPTIREKMGTEHRRAWQAGEHRGVELHLSNSYFTVTGAGYGGHADALRLVPLEDVLWLIETAAPAFLRAAGEAAGKPAEASTATRDTSGSGVAYSLLLDLFRAGSTEEEARVDIEHDQGDAGEWWRRVDGRQHERAVAKALAKAEGERARRVDAFDSCWSPEELSRARLPALRSDDFGAPMMRGDKPIINTHNAILYLGRNRDTILPDLRRNEMTGRDEWLGGVVDDAALTLARVKLERLGLETIGKDLVAEAVTAVARRNSYHPIREELGRLVHDGKPRLDSWLVRLIGADDTPYVRAVGRAFLIQMVARVMRPGCKADHVLVFSGPQGVGKSSACRILAGDYFSDNLPAIDGGKDTLIHLRGKWLIELSELAPSRKSLAEDLKAFLTTTVDSYRDPYGRVEGSWPRQCVFVGTTNAEEFLNDDTGGRRFWPVVVPGVIDTDGLAAERDQLLAEALVAFNAGEAWHLSRAFESHHAKPAQEAARIGDTWADIVGEWLEKPAGGFDEEGEARAQVSIPEVLGEALGIPPAQQNMAAQKRAGAIMRGLGWAKVKSDGRMVWRRQGQ